MDGEFLYVGRSSSTAQILVVSNKERRQEHSWTQSLLWYDMQRFGHALSDFQDWFRKGRKCNGGQMIDLTKVWSRREKESDPVASWALIS